MNRTLAFAVFWFVAALCTTAGISVTATTDGQESNLVAAQQLSEQLRSKGIAERRSICGRILRIFPDGILVESGYTNLARAPLTKSWLIPGTVTAARGENLVETREPGALCVGTVFLTDLPRGKPHEYDYVVIAGYPTGEFTYTSVGSIRKTVRRFSANLDKAVRTNLAAQEKQEAPAVSAASKPFLVCVSNEKSGDVTLIDGEKNTVVATVPVGKRPRGIHASPDGKLLYVALSGSPIAGPRIPGAREDDDPKVSDPAADGIGIVDLANRKFRQKIFGGADPEQFAVSRDGLRLYIANEDSAGLSIVQAADGHLDRLVKVKSEPEGVAITPDGKAVYLTCETRGDIFVISTESLQAITNFTVDPRPRNVVFLPDGSRAFIPSEAAGTVSVVDTRTFSISSKVQLPPNSRPMGMAISADGKWLYVTTGWAGTVCAVDTGSGEVTAAIKVGQRPWGVALSPDGRRLYTANGPSNDISVVDLASRKELTRVAAGHSPWGIAVVERGE